MTGDDSITEHFAARAYSLSNRDSNNGNNHTTTVSQVSTNDSDYSSSTMRIRYQRKRQVMDNIFTIRIPPSTTQSENRIREIQRILKLQKNGSLQLGLNNEIYTSQDLSLLCRALVGSLKPTSHHPLQSVPNLQHLRKLLIGWTIPQSWLSRLASLISTSGGEGVFPRLESFALVNQTGLQWYTLQVILQQLKNVRHLEFQRVRLLPSACGSDDDCSIVNVLKYLPRRRQLSTLNLIQCGVQDRDCVVLCKLLQSRRGLLSNKGEYASLNLRGNNRLTRGVGLSISELMKSLVCPFRSSLNRLDLTECGLSTIAVSCITDALLMTLESGLSSTMQSSSNPNHKGPELILARNYRIGKLGNSDNMLLKRFFMAGCTALTYLDLSFCNFSNEDVTYIFNKCLTDPGCKLEELVLLGCNRDVRGSLSYHGELWNMLEVNTSLSRLVVKTDGSSSQRQGAYNNRIEKNDDSLQSRLHLQSRIHDVSMKNYQLQALEIDDFSSSRSFIMKSTILESDDRHGNVAVHTEVAVKIDFWLQLNRAGRRFLRIANQNYLPHQQECNIPENDSTDVGHLLHQQGHRHYRLENFCWSHLLANTANCATATSDQASVLFWLLRNGGMEQIQAMG